MYLQHAQSQNVLVKKKEKQNVSIQKRLQLSTCSCENTTYHHKHAMTSKNPKNIEKQAHMLDKFFFLVSSILGVSNSCKNNNKKEKTIYAIVFSSFFTGIKPNKAVFYTCFLQIHQLKFRTDTSKTKYLLNMV